MAELSDVFSLWNIFTALVLFVLTRHALALYEAFAVSELRHMPCTPLRFVFPYLGIWTVIRGVGYKRSEYLHDRFGSVVRLGPNNISIADPQLVNKFLKVDDLGKNKEMYQRLKLFDGDSENILQTTNRPFHRRARRMVSPAFSIRALNALEPYMVSVWKAFEDKVRGEWEATKRPVEVDAVKVFHNIALDVIGETAFGSSFRMVESGANPLLGALDTLLRFAQVKMLFPFLDRVPSKYLPVARAMELQRALMDEVAAEREALNARGGRREDILQLMLDHVDQETGHKLTAKEIETNANVFLAAGSETSANTMTWLLSLVLAHPAALARLRAELDAAFPDVARPLDLAALKRLPYLDAVIKEAQRLKPVVTAVFRQVDEPVVVEGVGSDGTRTKYNVPAGTKVMIPMYVVHRSPQVWLRAREFLPERWLADATVTAEEEAWGIHLEEHGAEQGEAVFGKPKLVNRDAFWPFSAGSRDCLGRNFALNEMRLVLGHLLRRFDVEAAYDTAEEVEGRAFVTLKVARREGLRVRLTPRTS